MASNTCNKNISKSPNNIVTSPAYGKIIKINDNKDNVEIIIFLSPLNKHSQHFPLSGKITSSIYDNSGIFGLANYADKSKYNEKNITTLNTEHGNVIIKQVAGYFYRRISVYKRVGDVVNKGDELGYIHFGSRVDLILPKSKGNFNLAVKENEHVCGPSTIIGYYE